MPISDRALAELEQKTLALRQPGNRICAYTDSSALSGWVLLGLLIDDNFVAIAIPRSDYRAGDLCKILGFEDPFDPNIVYTPPAASAYSRAVQQKLRPPQAPTPPQATARSAPPPPPSRNLGAAPTVTTAQPHQTSPDRSSDSNDPEPAWPDEPSIPFEASLTPLRGDEWDEPPGTTPCRLSSASGPSSASGAPSHRASR